MSVALTRNDEYMDLPVSEIRFSGLNTRQINKKSASFEELKTSISSTGVTIPIMVRKNGDGYILIAGERRITACQELNIEVIPAIIKDCSEKDAIDIMFLENYNRDDLTALEEGEAVALLLKRYDGDYNAVASKLGKTRTWVASHAKINEELSRKWKAEIKKNPGKFDLWTAAHFAEVVKFPAAMQDVLLNDLKPEQYNRLPQLKEKVAEYQLNLKAAPWDKEKKHTIEIEQENQKPKKLKRCCVTCTKRTGSRADLFYDNEDEDIANNDRCLDPDCYDMMKGWHILQSVNTAMKTNPDIKTFIAPDNTIPRHGTYEYSVIRSFQPLYSWEYTPCKKAAKGAIAAIVVSGKSVGNIRYIAGKGSSSSSSKSAENTGTQKKPKTLKERRDMLNRKRWAYVIEKFREIFGDMSVDNLAKEKRDHIVRALLSVYTTKTVRFEECDFNDHTLYKAAYGKKPAELHRLLFEMMKPSMLEELRWGGPVTQTPDSNIKTCEFFACLTSYDLKDLIEESISEYPEPKTWKNLKADGTPKNQTKKKRR